MTLVLSLAGACLLATAAAAAPPNREPASTPLGDTFVVDEAGRLTPDARARMTRQLAALMRDADVEVVALLVATLNGTPLAGYAEARFEAWQIGGRTRGNRGALLVVAMREQRVRLAVGYDLEAIFPDAFVSYVEQAQLRPYFQSGRLAEGIEATVELLARRAFEGVAGRAYDPSALSPRSPGAPRTGGGGAEARVPAGDPSPPLRSDPALRAAFGPQPTAEAAWLQFLELNRRRVKDSDLGLYDDATRARLTRRPQTDAGQDHTAALYTGQRYEIRVLGDRAAVVFPEDPRHLLAPWFFHRSPTGWRLDGAMYPNVIIYNHLNQWRFARRDHPYGFAFTDYAIDVQGFARYRGGPR